MKLFSSGDVDIFFFTLTVSGPWITGKRITGKKGKKGLFALCQDDFPLREVPSRPSTGQTAQAKVLLSGRGIRVAQQ